MRFGGPRWRQDGAKTRPRWLQDAASNLALFQEASKTLLDLDFHRFWTPPGRYFLQNFDDIFALRASIKLDKELIKSRDLEELEEAK